MQFLKLLQLDKRLIVWYNMPKHRRKKVKANERNQILYYK